MRWGATSEGKAWAKAYRQKHKRQHREWMANFRAGKANKVVILGVHVRWNYLRGGR